MNKYQLTMIVNGQQVELQVDPRQRLIDVLRDNLFLTGTKEGCSEGECGACTVIIDGQIVNSCLVMALQCESKSITTIEGLTNKAELHPIQKAFLDNGAVQCGYCTPGMILATKALLENNPNPSSKEIKVGLSGNLCRCTGYSNIFKAVDAAAKAGEKANE